MPTVGRVPLPLAGCTVGITADRRRDELESLLVRRGARVVSGPALRIVPVAEDEHLTSVTEDLVAHPPDVLVVTTGVGFRGWVEAADGWGLAEPLLTALAGARVLARGPKATGALRAAGLREEWSPDSESSDEVLARLLEEGVRGSRVAVQLHGEPQTGFCEALREAGAEVVEVPVYRWVPPHDVAPLHRLIDAVLAGDVDALDLHVGAGRGEPADRTPVPVGSGCSRPCATRSLVACVGPVDRRAAAGEQASRACSPSACAARRARAHAWSRSCPARRTQHRRAPASTLLELRGHARARRRARASSCSRAPGGRAVGRSSTAGAGAVARPTCCARAWRDEPADEHAVEMTVARLRAALGPAGRVVRDGGQARLPARPRA